MSDSTSEQPDAFALAAYAEEHRRSGRRLWILVAGSLAAVALAVVLTVLVPDWLWFNILGASVLIMVAGIVAAVWPEYTPSRPRPDTPLEVGQVLGCVVRHWSHHGDNTVRVYLRACGGPETLLHASITVPCPQPADVPVGTMLAFRRYPTMRHLIWLAGEAPSSELVVSATAADPEAAERLLANGSRGTGRVTGVSVGDPTEDGRWQLDVALSLSDGTTCRARCVLAAEQLGSVAGGAELPVAYRKRIGGHADGVIIFPSMTVHPDP